MLPTISTLKKNTLEATFENINRTLKCQSGENYDNVKDFIQYDDTLNVFEKKVQAIIIDSLRIKEGVVSCLLSGDVHLIMRVLKCDWFFQDSLSPEFYENTIFPNVSLSTRCKIINKLARNIKSEQNAEHFFHFTKHNYGSRYAEMFLPKCSMEFINAYITECKPLFHNNNSVKILINICERYPEIAVSFLESVFHKDYPHKSKRRMFGKLILYLARYFPLKFMPFFEKYYSEILFFRFGKKLTKSFSAQLKNLVKNSSGELLRGVINTSSFFKCLTFEDQVDFLDCMVRAKNKKLTIGNWSLALPNLLHLFRLKSPKERVRLFEFTFSKLYNEKFGDHPELWTPRFLEVLPVDYRSNYVNLLRNMDEDRIMELKLHKDCDDLERDVQDIFVYLMHSKLAFPLLTELMKKMPSVGRREILLREMIRNCVINEDSEYLEIVLKYIINRHRNDDPNMLIQMSLYLQSLPHIRLNANTCDLLEEMAVLIIMKKREYNICRGLMEKSIRFRLKNGLDVRSQLRNMIKLNFINYPYDFEVVDVTKPYSREIINLYYNEIIHLVKAEGFEEPIKEKLFLALVRTINTYNSRMRRKKINIEDYPCLLDELDKIVVKQKNSFNYVIMDAFMKNPYLRDKYATQLLQFSLKPNFLQNLLKVNPDYVVNSIENILNDLFTEFDQFRFKKFITSRCRLDFLNITDRMAKISGEKFKTSASLNRKVNALKMYSHLTNVEDFAEFVKEYIPDKDEIKFDKDQGEFHEIQTIIPQVIKNMKPDSKNLPLLSKYLNRDFLRWAISSFDSACLNTPSSVIVPMLKDYLPHKTVSVKKVILHRIRDISVHNEKLKYFQLLWDKEDHPNVKSVIFKTISKCFYENPSSELFALMKKCISEADELIIKDRLQLSKVPAQYLNEYTIILWKFTEKYESRRFTTHFRNELIQNFAPMNIWILSEEFCEMIIKRYLFVVKAKVHVNNFSCYYLISNPYSMNDKLKFIIGLMRERRENYGDVKTFIRLLRSLSLEDPKRFAGVFEGILEEWPKIYTGGKMFDEYLLLQYAKGYNNVMKRLDFERSGESGMEFGKELREIINKVPMYEFFSDIFKETIQSYISGLSDFDELSMINGFLGDDFGRTEAVIGVSLLPSYMIDIFKQRGGGFSRDPHMKENFMNTVNKLKNKNDDVVKVYLNIRLDNKLD